MSIETDNGILFDKIGGWLILPAFLHPIISIWYDGSAAIEAFNLLQSSMPASTQIYIGTMVAAYAGLCVAWLIILYLALRLDRIFPAFYIGVVLTDMIIGLTIISIVIGAYNVSFTPEDTGEIARSIISACIWIPYMLISKRVKATFFDIPMSPKLAFKNVNSPLAQVAAAQRQARALVEESEPLNMVQRLGMVFYWTGLGLCVLLSLGGLVAFANRSDNGAAIAIFVAAGVSWLGGRACKYVLAGR